MISMARTIRADLSAHGPIGFQPYWLRKQGYEGDKILELMTDACIKRGINLCAVVSQADDMNAPYQDRFKILREQINDLPTYYNGDTLGGNNNVIVVSQRNGNFIYFVNAQSVVVMENGRKLSHTVIGTNQVPNHLTLEETIKYSLDNGLINIAEHPFVVSSSGQGVNGIGIVRFTEHIHAYDAVDFDAQLAIPDLLTHIPKIGPQLARYSHDLNERARGLAHRSGKPFLPGSNAHTLDSIGRARIVFDANLLRMSSEEDMTESLRDVIRKNRFTPQEGYEPLVSWYRWTSTFKKGLSRTSDE